MLIDDHTCAVNVGFIEALFMSIYVYAADRIPHRWRIVSVSFVAIGAAASALLITDANAFMNAPQGFRLVAGKAVDVHPWQAVLFPGFVWFWRLFLESKSYAGKPEQ